MSFRLLHFRVTWDKGQRITSLSLLNSISSKDVRNCAQFEHYYPVHRGQVEVVELTYFCLITCKKCTYVVDLLTRWSSALPMCYRG